MLFNFKATRLSQIVLCLAVLGFSSLSYAERASGIEWVKVSEAKATWLWFDVYNAELYLPKNNLSSGKSSDVKSTLLQDKQPLRLKLCYLLDLKKSQIIEAANEVLAENTIDNLLKQNIQKLHSRYEDVKPGDCYELLHDELGTTYLLLNSKTQYKTAVNGFKALYFGIWLGSKPLSVELKKQLLNF